MAKLSMECKKLMVKELSDYLNKKDVLIVTNYKGLSAQDLNELRRELRKASGEYQVIKHSMAKRAFSEGDNNKIVEFIDGEVGIAAYNEKDPINISKVLMKFAKANQALKIRAGIMEGKILSKEDIRTLSVLPTKDVLLGQLANVLNAPIQNLAGVLHGILSKIVYALNAVKDKRQEAKDKEQKETEKIEEKKEEDKEAKDKEQGIEGKAPDREKPEEKKEEPQKKEDKVEKVEKAEDKKEDAQVEKKEQDAGDKPEPPAKE